MTAAPVHPLNADATGLRLDAVRIELGSRTAPRVLVPTLTLHVPPGQVAVVMGDSGSGKSSLLAWLAGVAEPPLVGVGRVRVDGVDVTSLPPERRRLGLMLQDDVLFPHMTVRDNLLFALPRDKTMSRAQRVARVEQALRDAELPGLGDRWPVALSGGQRSRVALVRTLLAAPRAVLLDEPFSRLDSALRARMRTHVWAALATAELPGLLVTHDPADIPAGAVVIQLPSHPSGAPSVWDTPA